MKVSRRTRLQLRASNASFVVLFVAVIGLLMWLSSQYHAELDWTRDGRNTLSATSVAVVETLDKPLTVTAFVSERRDLRERITGLLARFRKAKPDLVLEMVNPDTEPGRTREAGIQYDGELLIEYDGRTETVRQLGEEAVTNALARLGRGGERRVAFLQGHGERRPDRQANHDLSTWAGQMKKRGIQVSTTNLGTEHKLPDGVAALVIAGPQADLLPGEVEIVRRYVDDGGNLLWLAEPGGLAGLEPLAEQLGIEFQAGTVVDPNSQVITGGSAAFVVVANYGGHPVVKGLASLTLFPETTGLRMEAPEGWQAETFLETLPSAWLETGPLAGAIAFDPDQDTAGPITIGVALTRDREEREQRVAVIADGDFLSNSYIGNGGNLDLAMNLVNWISRDDAYINIPARATSDLGLNLSRRWQWVIAGGFLVALPLGLVLAGVGVWLRRRKR